MSDEIDYGLNDCYFSPAVVTGPPLDYDYIVYDPATKKTTPVIVADPEAEKERLWQLVVQVSR
jgi:hypothetical protein